VRTKLAVLCLVAWLLAGCAGSPYRPDVVTQADDPLYGWVDRELGPYLSERLGTHPRFKGEPLQFVAMDDDVVLAHMDELQTRVRDRVVAQLVHVSGINLVWQPPRAPTGRHRDNAGCDGPTRVHYYIGIETHAVPEGGFEVSVRALDLREESWVAGFGQTWRGRLSPSQVAASGRLHADDETKGTRSHPFQEDEADLMAGRLARDLRCLLQGTDPGERTVHVEPSRHPHPFFRSVIDLLGNYLAGSGGVRITDEGAQANLRVHGEVHALPDGLYQLWVRALPNAQQDSLPATDISAYARVADVAPSGPLDAQRSPPQRFVAPETQPSLPLLIAAFQVRTAMDGAHLIGNRERAAGEREVFENEALPGGAPLALSLAVGRPARVFLLHRDGRGLLTRLSPARCGRMDELSQLLLPGSTLRFPDGPGNGGLMMTLDDEAGEETFYAVAVDAGRRVSAVERHVQGLPAYCAQGGLGAWRSADAVRWLQDLHALVAEGGEAVAWTARRVAHVSE